MPPTRRKSRRNKVLDDATKKKDDESKENVNPLKRQHTDTEKPSKKARHGRARGIRGALNGIADMPLDVVYDIFSHLLPLDLLHLARSSKWLRGELMRASAKPLWKAARQNVDGLPDCPPDMAEPMYANLAFESFCNVCLRPNAGKTDWGYRLRVCKLCFEDSVEDSYWGDWWRLAIGFLPYPTQAPKTGWLAVPLRVTRQYRMEYEALRTNEERAANIKAQREMFAAREVTALQMRAWEANRAARRSKELDEIRQDRLFDILIRLDLMGWSTELEEDNINQISSMAEVKKPLKLTERAWQKILPDILPILEASEDRRHREINSERWDLARQCYEEYAKTFPPGVALPPSIAITTLPEFQAIIKRPYDVDVTLAEYNDAAKIIPEFLVLWGALAEKKLLAVLKEHHTFADPDTKLTYSAATVRYKCCQCPDIVLPTQLWTHQCFVSSWATCGDSPREGRIISFSFDDVRLASVSAYETAQRICQDVGLDPNMPYHEMVGRKDRFISFCCPGVHKETLNWEQLMGKVYQAPCCAQMKYGLDNVTA